MINPYHTEQAETFDMVRRHLAGMHFTGKKLLLAMVRDYIVFRCEVERFLTEHFSQVCTAKCYRSKLSACCSREGIITFFADIVINSLVSENHELDRLMMVLQHRNDGAKCVYLGENGCLWRMKPIVCEFFLCDFAQNQVFSQKHGSKHIWEELKDGKKRFTWPDQPVLFDALEKLFLDAGYQSPLMYMHNSPGLLRVKCLSARTRSPDTSGRK